MLTSQIFEGLSNSEIHYIVGVGVIRPIDGGELLFRKGDVGHEMYVILTGKVDIFDEYGAKTSLVAQLGPGEFFGEMALFEKEHTRSTHAIVSEPSQLLVLSEEMISKLFRKKLPKRFLVNIIRVLCHRLHLTNSMYMLARFGDGKLPEVARWLAQGS
ncbi:MAG: cyclic nucleotide-binding domain-containing protein [Candidatus Hydrogenedentota bacterium]|nr:MAG: cyclic nucleotide-binding domain-containing protein [Candidatus Hydrogenedentota bacterium]